MTADTLTLSSVIPAFPYQPSSIDSITYEIGSGYKPGGKVSVTTKGLLTLEGGASLNAGTGVGSLGDGGELIVDANSMLIEGAANSTLPSEIVSASRGSGKAGKIIVDVTENITLKGGGLIDANAVSTGAGGNTTVTARNIDIDGGFHYRDSKGVVHLAPSGIASSAEKAGTGGSITVNVPGHIVMTNGGQISATSAESNGGSILINAGGLSLSEAEITTSAFLDGGNITLNIRNVVSLLSSTIKTDADGINTTGGNITIDPQFVLLNDSLIDANDPLGTGGNITITTSNFVSGNSLLTATGTTNGTIEISSPVLDLSGSLVPLKGVLDSEDQRLRESCARSLSHGISSLIVVGRGGTESAPTELQPDLGVQPALTSVLH